MSAGLHRLAFALLALCLLAPATQARAQAVRAWLDRDTIALGETATLNIEVTGTPGDAPDYAPLLRDFRLGGYSSSRRYQQSGPRSELRTLYGVALEPLRAGVLDVPPLRAAGTRTPPLRLEVTAALPAPASAQGDGLVFIEAAADAASPWVQQAVGYVVRLYVGVPLVSGTLEQAEPDGATLQRVGEDLRYTREIDGRRYTVIERHYLLLPERSGTIEVPGARFSGRGAAGFFDDFFGTGNGTLAASGAARRLEVRPVPDTAPQPWLPLRKLALRWTAAPREARAGEAATVTLEASADGATAAQLPELRLPPIEGAQVFADPVQVDERFVDGRPHATATRSFSIVADRPGTLRVRAPTLSWWDVGAGAARTTVAPGFDLHVAPGQAPVDASGATPAELTDPPGATRWVRVPWVQDPVRPWALATVLFALAWLLTLAWGLQRRRPPARTDAGPAHAAPSGGAVAGLSRALRDGDLADIADALCAAASPPAPGLDALLPRLGDPAQREAVGALQRARWSDGDPAAARAMLREAFREGPQWQRRGKGEAPAPLPPLYP